MSLDATYINRAAPPGSMRYFSVLYAPPERRDALLALYVIDAEVRESAHSASHDVAHTRLQWWRAEVDRLVNGNPLHPATRLLLDQHAGDRATLAVLHELLAAADMDLARMTYANLRELRAYGARSGGAVFELLATHLLAPAPLDPESRAAANRLGVGVRLAEMLRDLRRDACDGRLYLPIDHLEQHDLRLEDLRAGEVSASLRAALGTFAQAARADLDACVPRARADLLRPLRVLAALHRRLLDRIAARHYDVAAGRIELGPLEKPWVAWREARRSS